MVVLLLNRELAPPSNQPEIESKAVTRLLKLVEFNLSPIDSTNIFSDKVLQNELINAIGYWFDQTKMFFGEPVSIMQEHNMREAGIDIIIELMVSRIKFGIQIKSPSDMKGSDFSRHVKSQIFDSHKHKLSKLIIALAGDLSKKGHSQRIGGIISELSQIDTGYVIVLPPEKMVTIYDTFVRNEHPMKHLLLDYQTATVLMQGIVEALSNEERTVSANINVENRNKPNYSESAATFSLKINDPKILDELEKLPYSGELLKNDKLKDFSVKSNKGTEVRSKEQDVELYAWSEREDEFPIAIQIVDEQDKTIKSLGLQLFAAKTEDKITHIESKDRNQPLRVKITESEGKIRTVGFSIDDTKGDAVQLLEAMDFIRALDPSRRLKVYNSKRGKFEISSINAKPKDFDQLRYDFIRSLAIIQKHTNEAMHLPDSIPTLESVMEVFRTAKILEKGTIQVRNLTVSIPRSEAIKLVDDYTNDMIAKDTTVQINLTRKVLDKEVIIKPRIELSKLKPKGNPEELRKIIAEQNQDNVDIELERVA